MFWKELSFRAVRPIEGDITAGGTVGSGKEGYRFEPSERSSAILLQLELWTLEKRKYYGRHKRPDEPVYNRHRNHRITGNGSDRPAG
ncbi:hypothetical protein CEXT_192761 [Caerostris extrusa]|uniref:Uncharacterized protein n=1 Tax=Caerostris extrusa TaxID=172846 RepID=A0AAV4XUR8_CAEEX|nr:hypothetical protein CEXT_192761 [Caerostris extrusa]